MEGKPKTKRVLGLALDLYGHAILAVRIASDGHGLGDADFAGSVALAPGDIAVVARAMAAGTSDSTLAQAAALFEDHAAALIDEAGPIDLIGVLTGELWRDPRHHPHPPIFGGQALAAASGLPVITDFAANDMAFGGFGRPLAPVLWHMLARNEGLAAPVGVVELGATTSLIYADPRLSDPAAEGALLAFEVAPGLADLTGGDPSIDLDVRLEKARRAAIDDGVVEAACAERFVLRLPPKVLTSHDYCARLECGNDLSADKALATRVATFAALIAEGRVHFPSEPALWFISGPGAQFALLRDMVGAALGTTFAEPERLGLPEEAGADSAFLAAVLAARVSAGRPTTFPATTGIRAPLGGGLIARPEGQTELLAPGEG